MAAHGSQGPPQAGERAPDFRLANLDGGETRLADLLARGRVLLAFFKVSCPVCQLTFPFLERLHTAGALPVTAISQDDADATGDFLRHFRITLPTLLDSEARGFPASHAYRLVSVPTLFLVEPDGLISLLLEGWNKRSMEALARDAGVTLFRPGEYVPAWKAG